MRLGLKIKTDLKIIGLPQVFAPQKSTGVQNVLFLARDSHPACTQNTKSILFQYFMHEMK